MKTHKTTLTTLLIMALVVPATAFVAVPQAEASCSYQGYINSHGKCGKSFKNDDYNKHWNDDDEDEDEDEDDDDDDDYDDDDYYKFSNKHYFWNSSVIDNDFQISRLLALIAELQAILENQKGLPNTNFDSEIDVLTLSATDIDEDGAKLRGEVDFNNSDTATVWFEYGKNRNNLNTKTSEIDLDDTDSTSFNRAITNLDDDTVYYFRAIGEDEDGEVDKGTILSLRTDDSASSSNQDDPDVVTDNADDVTEDSAELNGSVDMNDFENGKVFFVYGEDKSMVEDVEDDFDTYSDIDESGNDLQKVLIDSSFDGDDNFSYDISDLDDNTNHYFSMCLEYEDEDNDEVLVCGNVKSFETDVK